MLGAIITIVIGWFVFEKVPSIISSTGSLSTIIKLVGVIICIAGFVGLVKSLF